MKAIIKKLERQIKESKKDGDRMDECNWAYEKGILLTPNEAKRIVVALKIIIEIEQSLGIPTDE